jgi:glycosyltransferase involved in cell wall biosynthesis
MTHGVPGGDAAAGRANGPICVVVQSWPRLSMTFVAQELVGLEENGLDLFIETFGEPDTIRHPIHARLKAPVKKWHLDRPFLNFLPAWLKVRSWPGYAKAVAALREELKYGSPKKVRKNFARGVVMAAQLPKDTRAIYVHFLGTPAIVARFASLITGLPLAASGHARDIWTSPDAILADRLDDMEWCATCTTVGADHLKTLTDSAKIHLIHHGLSFDRFPVDPPVREAADGRDPKRPVRLLSVGRSVEKKGFDVLLKALAALPADRHWHWTHVGEGKIEKQLHAQASALGLDDRIDWRGAQDQLTVIDLFRSSDLFVLPCREASDGDRDGLPNVLMEAQSQALACLSTNFSEIPELIIDGETGVMVEPNQVAPLTEALDDLIRDPAKRERYGMAGYTRVRSTFQSEAGIGKIAWLLRQIMR